MQNVLLFYYDKNFMKCEQPGLSLEFSGFWGYSKLAHGSQPEALRIFPSFSFPGSFPY